MGQAEAIRSGVEQFVAARAIGAPGAYTMAAGCAETLYSSCFAAMTLHYTGALARLSDEERAAWAAYINQWQDPETGHFLGPELVREEITSPKFTWDVVTSHLDAHVLPALSLLGAKPAYPLRFAHQFLEREYLERWILERDWHNAWLEGNNILPAQQFLLHLRDVEGMDAAQGALDRIFSWLDRDLDPATGLWGTNGYVDAYAAAYGGYHQALAYFYEGRTLPYATLVDTVLKLQHGDGSFTKEGGGGACEDVDCIDLLVNGYKRSGHRPLAVRRSLRRAVASLLRQRTADGGFLYTRGRPFIHMGIPRTRVPAETAHLFATWFRVHTLALCAEVLRDDPIAEISWGFNDVCSMGWHRSGGLPEQTHGRVLDAVPLDVMGAKSRMALHRAKAVARQRFKKYKRMALKRVGR